MLYAMRVSFIVMMICNMASNFILYSLSVLCFLPVILFTLMVCIFSLDFKYLEHVFMVAVHRDLCILVIKSSFCSPIAHTICGVHARSATYKLWVQVLHRLSSTSNYIFLSSFLMRCFSISLFIFPMK